MFAILLTPEVQIRDSYVISKCKNQEIQNKSYVIGIH